ncbi:hypothetical protein KKA14_07680 [bacterium]|nr:hypothetical protein [bacterium]
MSDNQEDILDKIRERVLQREKEIQLKQDKEANLEATLQALEAVTEVPREEMERIVNEIKGSYENPGKRKNESRHLPGPQFENLPATVCEALEKLPSILQEEFFEEYAISHRKSGLSYLFWLIPPPFSGHYLYNNRPFTQLFYFLTCGGFFIWWVADFFRMSDIVQDENRKIARKLLKKMMKQSLRRDGKNRLITNRIKEEIKNLTGH